MPVDVMVMSPERLSRNPWRSASPLVRLKSGARKRSWARRTRRQCPSMLHRVSKLEQVLKPECVSKLLASRPARLALRRALLGRLRVPGHRLGAGRDRLDNIVIAGAAADIALEFLADRVLVEVVALTAHHVDRRHDHARCAIAALQAVILTEGGLHRMQLLAIGEALDGGDARAVALHDEQGACLHALAVHMHRAGAALARIAAHMGAGEALVLA